MCKRWHRLVFSDAAAQLWRWLDIELTAELLASPQRLASTRQLVQRTGRFAERAVFWTREGPALSSGTRVVEANYRWLQQKWSGQLTGTWRRWLAISGPPACGSWNSGWCRCLRLLWRP